VRHGRTGWLLAALFAIAWAETVPAAEISDNPSGGAISHHALRAKITPATAGLSVVDTLTILHRPATPASLKFPFMLSRALQIDHVEGIGFGVTGLPGRLTPRDYWRDPPYDQLGGYESARTISIVPTQLDGSWPDSVRVIVRYHGAVYDSLRMPKAAYARGFESTSGLIDPRGAFLSGATFWIPSRPDERFTFRSALETPADWHGVSQGGLLRTQDGPGARVNTWDCPQPMEEIYLVAGPYTLRRATRSGVDVETFTYADTDSALCRRYIEGTDRYLKLYGEKIGRYPFAKFALVENFWQTGFGMPSFTLLGNQVIRLPFILDTSYGHEILHNWWGNGVLVDYGTGNWCEGLTTYGADNLYKEMASADEARDSRRTSLQGYLDYVSQNEDFPLRLFREREDFATQAVGYGKSMMVFHQVRRLLGDEAFWGALRDFYSAHLFHRASWDDLFESFGKRSPVPLDGWKEQWLERTGAPQVVLGPHGVMGPDKKGYAVEVTILQTQPDLYDLRVPVRLGWDNPRAESTLVVTLKESKAMLTVHTRRAPDWVAVDPDFDVLRRIAPAEIPGALSRTLGADTAVVVIASGVAPPEVFANYEKVAAEWAKRAKLGILREADLTGKELPALPIWLFGRGPLAERLVAERGDPTTVAPTRDHLGWRIAGVDYEPGMDVVLSGGDPPRVWTLIDAGEIQSFNVVCRKIPHYGKYSYLVFEDGKNVAKGSWEVLSSPLRDRFAAKGR
jgi:aminopeptidase N